MYCGTPANWTEIPWTIPLNLSSRWKCKKGGGKLQPIQPRLGQVAWRGCESTTRGGVQHLNCQISEHPRAALLWTKIFQPLPVHDSFIFYVLGFCITHRISLMFISTCIFTIQTCLDICFWSVHQKVCRNGWIYQQNQSEMVRIAGHGKVASFGGNKAKPNKKTKQRRDMGKQTWKINSVISCYIWNKDIFVVV